MVRKIAGTHLQMVILILSVIWWHGCAGLPRPTHSKHLSEQGVLGICADFFASQDQALFSASVTDPGVFRVEAYPYLRTNRFLASFGKEIEDESAFSDWVDRLQALDQKTRRHEIANLPQSKMTAVQLQETAEKVTHCGNLLKQKDFESPLARQQLGQAIFSPDEYIEARRFLGIYPLTGWFVSRGVSNWHEEARQRFSLKPPSDWQAIHRYAPLQEKDLPATERISASVPRDALGIPEYTPEVMAALFAIHAPVWEVDTQSDDDRIGSPFWTADKQLEINIDNPVTYLLHNFTRFNRKVLTQLNYIIWFPARPKTHAFDIYGGHLDGVNYRVTLDIDGAPLLYETIHNCGCYYKAYPTRRLEVLAEIDYAEPPLVLNAPIIDPASEVMVVAMESRTHYVQHLYTRAKRTQTGKTYTVEDYDVLLSLPLTASQRQSMFRPDGLAYGSERLERFILWPTGVLSPGAMRQWGRHAVAFVGERHFDDPFYLEKIFKISSDDANSGRRPEINPPGLR